jgi:hypothetical protein
MADDLLTLSAQLGGNLVGMLLKAGIWSIPAGIGLLGSGMALTGTILNPLMMVPYALLLPGGIIAMGLPALLAVLK